MGKRWSGLMAVAAVASCGRDAVPRAVTHTDSAGVQIVASTAPQWAAGHGWTVDSVPRLDLSRTGSGAEFEFFRVRNAVRLGDGSIAVANSGTSEVRLYSAAGKYLATFGRDGDGPGEFRRLTSVRVARGDSLLAFDYWQRRVTFFSRDGSGHRTVAVGSTNMLLRDLAPLSDGTLVVTGELLGDTPDGLYRLPKALLLVAATGELRDTVAVIPGYEGFQFATGDAAAIFHKDAYMAVHGEHIYLGDGDSMQVSVYSNEPRLAMIMRVPGYDLNLTAEQLKAERAIVEPGPRYPAAIREALRARPNPETRPAYSALFVDTDGFLWAPQYRGFSEADQAPVCTILQSTGRMAWFRAPADTLHAIRSRQRLCAGRADRSGWRAARGAAGPASPERIEHVPERTGATRRTGAGRTARATRKRKPGRPGRHRRGHRVPPARRPRWSRSRNRGAAGVVDTDAHPRAPCARRPAQHRPQSSNDTLVHPQCDHRIHAQRPPCREHRGGECDHEHQQSGAGQDPGIGSTGSGHE